ncbi:hypothetical protein C0J50_4223 [Silurus asotus]|uniref:Ig-like domain-containing protein n=1 Tax=Silurus asotus TaxID=30991 RepID=A0AAD5AB06_SILAS|nr:hypothetical protein C0J50_4223 [Silurus asotus]
MILLSISIFWLSVCVDPISADPPITVEAHVGSTALLPCNLSKVFTQTSAIQWKDNNEIVFERSINGTHDGEGYEGRVDVPEDELRKGNCSLVLEEVRVTDHAFYRSFKVIHVEDTNTDKIQEINRVQLDVIQSVSAQVGSTAVLPCDCRNISIKTPNVEWSIGDEIVFKREGKDTSYGEGYEGLVDVSEEELLKGNCSLVLKNISVTDEALYSGFILTNDKKNRDFVLKVKLSVSVVMDRLTDESREQVEKILERWRYTLERRGMKVSRSKTEYMCVNEREGSGGVRLQGEEVEKVEFRYLGSAVQSNGECVREVKKRVQAGWSGWRRVIAGVICDRRVSVRVKGKVYRTVVRPEMLYGLETVALSKRQEVELEVAELKMLRCLLEVMMMDRIRNEFIRATAHVGRFGDKVREKNLKRGKMIPQVKLME